MEINIKDVTSGKLDGQMVWICDLRFNDYANKPIRHVKPTIVLVRNNEYTKKRVYYSESHFVELNKYGDPVNSKIIAPFDNTGYRTYAGVPVKCFDSQSECEAGYNRLKAIAIKGLKDYIKDITLKTTTLIKELE